MSEQSDAGYPPPGAGGAPPPGPPPPPGPAYGPPPPAGPPAYGQPPYGQPAYGQPGHGPGRPGPWRPPVAQPGVVPLRQLTLGDVFGGSLQTIRRNPRTTIALSLAVSAVFMALPLVASLLWGLLDLGSVSADSFLSGSGAAGGTFFSVASNLGVVLNVLASIVITGLMTRVVASAVVGRPMRAGEAWARTRGRLGGLLLLLVVSVLAAVVLLGVPGGLGLLLGYALGGGVGAWLVLTLGLLVGVVLLVWVWTRWLLLATPALVLEGIGVRAALRRAGTLSRGQSWRLLGTALLAQLAAGVAAQVVAVPLAVVGAVSLFLVDSSWGPAVFLLATNLSTLLTTAIVGPFVAGVTTLQYVDQRFRKEGLDLALLEGALGDRPG